MTFIQFVISRGHFREILCPCSVGAVLVTQLVGYGKTHLQYKDRSIVDIYFLRLYYCGRFGVAHYHTASEHQNF